MRAQELIASLVFRGVSEWFVERAIVANERCHRPFGVLSVFVEPVRQDKKRGEIVRPVLALAQQGDDFGERGDARHEWLRWGSVLQDSSPDHVHKSSQGRKPTRLPNRWRSVA